MELYFTPEEIIESFREALMRDYVGIMLNLFKNRCTANMRLSVKLMVLYNCEI